MFSLVAAIPAIMVAVVASITLDIGLDRWFEIRTKTIISSSLSIADAYVQENARNLQGTTLSMAYDLDQRALALQPRPHRLSRIDDASRRSAAALAHAALIRADGSVIIAAETSADFDMPQPPAGMRWQSATERPAGADRAAHAATSSARSSSCARFRDAYLYTIRLVDPEVIKARQIVTANTDEYRGLEANRRDDADRLRAALSRPDADHRAVGDLDRHCGRRPAGAADPPVDRRGRRGGDRQSRRLRAGARIRRRRRLARRHLQQDAAGAEVAAQRDPAGQGPGRRAPPLLGSGAGRRHRRRHRRRSRPASITIVNRSAETMLAISGETALGQQPVDRAAACRPRLRDRPRVRPRRSIASR